MVLKIILCNTAPAWAFEKVWAPLFCLSHQKHSFGKINAVVSLDRGTFELTGTESSV